MPVLIQIDGYDPALPGAVSLRASNVDDDRVCHVDGANGIFWPAVAQLPELRYDLVDAAFSGRVDTPSSQIVLAVEPFPNLPRYQLSDARVRIWTGNAGDAWPWTLRFDGRCTAQPSVAAGRATLTIAVDDRWLDTPLLALYAGTTGAEGDAALKGQPKPLSIGAPRFAPARMIDGTNNVFQVSSGLIEDVEVAFERILRFGASAGDYGSYAALIAATIRPGQWATAKAVGMIRHGAPPAPGGRFVYHLKGDKAGPDGWVRLPGQVIKRLALIAGGAGRFSEASVDALDAARPWNISWQMTDQITAREAIQRIAASVNAVAGVSWLSQLFVAPLPSLVGSPAVTLNTDGSTLPAIGKVEQIEMDPPFWRMSIETERTWDVHQYSDIAFQALLVDRGAYVSTETYREGHITQDQGISWLYINPTASSSNAPPTLPISSSAYWKALDPKLGGIASGATADLTLTSIGSTALTIVGNTIVRNAGSGDYTACVIGAPSVGQLYAEVEIPSSGNYAMVALDNDATSTNYNVMDVVAHCASSSGIQVYVGNGTNVYNAVVGAVGGQKLGISYDGVRYRVWLNGVQQGADIPAAAGLRLWPKWWSYNSGQVLTGLRQMTSTSNLWADVGGANVPANNAGTTVPLTGLGTGAYTIVGNSFTKTSTAGAFDVAMGGPAYTGAIMAEMDINATGANYTMVGFDSGSTNYLRDVASTKFYAQYNYTSGTLAIYVNGAAAASPAVPASVVGKLTLTYDGVRFRCYVGGIKYGGDFATTAGQTLYPRWYGYNAPATFTGLNASQGAGSNLWGDQGGANVPANNATADISLVSIGSQASGIVGNTFLRAAGSADFNACVRGVAITGPQTVEADVVAGGYTFISLDEDATTFAFASMAVIVQFLQSTGAWTVYTNNVTVASGSLGAGVVGKVRLAYDGIRFRAFVNGTQLGTDIPATSPTFTLWPKWHDYNGGTLYATGLKAGPFNSSIWIDVGGTGRPSDNAGTSGILTLIGANSALVGNTMSKPGTGTHGAEQGGCVGQALYGTAFITSSIQNPTGLGGYETRLVLDSDNTSFTNATSDVMFRVITGNGGVAGAYSWYLYTTNGIQRDTGTGTGLTVNSRALLLYDGVNFYGVIDGAVKTQWATTAGQTLYPKVLDFYYNGVVGYPNGFTDILYGPWSENAWSRLGGTGKPADNAGTSGALTAIGSFTTITGNSTYKSGGTHGAFQGGTVGVPQFGSAFVTSSIINAVAGGSWLTCIALDDDATSVTDTANLYNMAIIVSGSGGYTWYLKTGASVTFTGTASGLTAASRMSLVYDGTSIYAIVDGVVLATITGVAAGLKFYPKTLDYHNNGAALSVIDILYGPWSENAWSRIGGTGKPANNAGTALTLVAVDTAKLSFVGNTITPLVAGAWTNGGYTQETLTGNAEVRFTTSGTTDTYMVGLDQGVITNAANNYNQIDYACFINSGGLVYYYESGGGGVNMGSWVAGDVFSVVYDGKNVYYVRDQANGTRTVMRTVAVGAGLTFRGAFACNSFAGPLGLQFRPYVDRGLEVAGSGYRLGDPRNSQPIMAMNLGYKFNGAISYTSATGTPATATISVAAGSCLIGSSTVSYSAMSVNTTGTGGTIVDYYLYVDDPSFAGGAQTLVATTTAADIYSNNARVYIGSCSVSYPTFGGGSGGGGGGGGTCVASDALVETFERGFVPASEIRAGDRLRVLSSDREGTEWFACERNSPSPARAYLLRSASGIELSLAESTPITLRDGSLARVADIAGQELPVCDADGFRWEACTALAIGNIEVAHIIVGQRTYAAGNEAGRSILTHNPSNPKP